jgi:hypothetical protein
VRVGEHLAIGLSDVADGNDPIKKPAEMNAVLRLDEAPDLVGEPFTELVPGRGVEPVRIVLR